MRGLITAAFLVFCISALGEQPSQRNSAQHETAGKEHKSNPSNADNQQPIAAGNSSPEKSNGTPNIATEAAQKKGTSAQYGENTPKLTDWLMVGLTAAYVIVSTCLLIAVRRQADIAEKAANAASASAEAAQSSVHAFINRERAWLRLSGLEWRERERHCNVVLKNFGNSPAWITATAGSFQWIKNVDELSTVPNYGDVHFESYGPVHPGKACNSIVITHEIGSHGRRVDREYRLAIFGFIKYRDRFGIDYPLKFCSISEGNSTFFFASGGPPGYNEDT